MKTYRFRNSVFFSEFETDTWSRESMSGAGDQTNKPRISETGQEEKRATAIQSSRKGNLAFAASSAAVLFVVSIAVLYVATCESGKMIFSARANIARTSTWIYRQNRRRSQTSTIPSVVSRFHSNRLEPGNGVTRRTFCKVGSESIIKPSVFLEVHRYRGGSQHNFRQRRWHSSKNDDIREKEEEEKKANNHLAPLIRSQQRVTKVVRQGAGAVFSLVGFVGSSFVSLVTDRRSFEDRFEEPIRALSVYLKTTGVDIELSESLNSRLGVNLCLLGRVHMYQAEEEALATILTTQNKKKRRRIGSKIVSKVLNDYSFSSSPSSSSKLSSSFLEEARRYMRYATAVYGQAMMNAVEVDTKGSLDGKVGRVTKESISDHISVPVDGIKLMDVSTLEGDKSHLRHMVVVDHENKKVVLSIRGTFSLEEIILDVAADTTEFCGGEAHSGMATMAERVWAKAGPTVKTQLEENPGYEFILTGHSLGAGTACLVTILVQNRRLLSKDQKIRCFAYASPPVYTPLEFVPKSVEVMTNFINENDVVPFLSIQKVRKLFSSLLAVDEYAHSQMTQKERYKVILGASEPPKELIASVLEAEGKRLDPKKGAPILYAPVKQNVWLKELRNEEGEREHHYRYELSTAREISQREIRVSPDMLVDHFP
eukprot:CAMPEP_0116121206 /NCGR_PEP_ID=MMETSP0329-20121206/3575_1 /TAXON_ID=697910 /ORGANISM="Pseudo-nitzschia arenysensis, Strain B593" /LENGTH=653 /DNA_ID=CAMNT_0003615007 /DNA_START=83 /DNA_END=2042 /DNA_ORIENTATION=+